jgi:hypothetical protein
MLTITGRAGALLSLLLLPGCLTSGLAPVPPPDLRIWVTPNSVYASAIEVQIQVSNLAGMPVRDPEDMGAGSYRMILVCPDIATCRTAAQRVADAPNFALGVDIEGSTRQRIPLKPTRAMSR